MARSRTVRSIAITRPTLRLTAALALSTGLGLALTALLLTPSARETIDLAIYLVVSGLASVLLVELLLLRRSRVLDGLSLRPKIVAAYGVGLLIAFANTIALAVLMFVNADHDLPMLIAILAFAGAIGIFVGYRLAGQIAGSLSSLTVGARRISRGEFSVRLPAESRDEIGELSGAFNEMAASLEEAARRQVQLEEGRKQLTAAISHDLRTPLASARALLEALDDKVVTDLDEQSDYHRRALNEIKSLGGLVDDLFQLSLLDVGALRLDLQPTPLQELVLDTVEGMRPAADRKGLSLSALVDDGIEPVMIDAPRMRRVLMNLVQNAIRHTPADGSVVVAAREQGESVWVEVRDTGEGIAPEELPRIWSRFFRTDPSRGRGVEGQARSGLGLSIARAIVETHGGEISASSEPGRGSVFRFTLPRYRHAV